MMKVFLEDGDPLIAKMFQEEGYEIVKEQSAADIVCFGGGDDVSPELYGENNTHSYSNMKRDLHCIYIYNKARSLGQKCVGICRGGQFLHVMNGGKLCQHIEGHRNKTHSVCDITVAGPIHGELWLNVTSDHHQSMSGSQFLDKNSATIGPNYVYTTLMAKDGTIECITYGHERGRADICYQPHPEWVPKGHECREYFFNLIRTAY